MKEETIRNLNLISIVINLIIMACLVSLIVPNIDKAEHDPLNYGARVYNIDYCQCHTNDNEMFFYNETNIWVTKDNIQKVDYHINFEDLKLRGE